MTITLLLTIDENNTIGNGASIPWDCEGIHKDMETVIKGNTIIMGRNAYNELACFRKTKVASRILFSNTVTSRLKRVSYTTNVYTALTLAKRIDKPVYILGGNQTAMAFLGEGVVTNLILYVVPGKHDGIKFMSVGPKSFSLTKVEQGDGYVVKHFAAIPNSRLPIPPIPEMNAPKCEPAKGMRARDKREVDKMLASVLSDGDYDMDDMDYDDINQAVYDLADNVDSLYDVVGAYADNQKNMAEKLNQLIKQDSQIISSHISLQERVLSIETMVQEKGPNIAAISLLLSFFALIVGVTGLFL